MSEFKKCPYCGEEIMADARKCKHCGEWLNTEAEPKQELVKETEKQESENQPKNEVIATTNSVEEPLTEKTPNKTKESLFKSCFWEQLTKHYWDFNGKVDRKTYWVYCLYAVLIMFTGMAVGMALEFATMSVIVPWIATILMLVSGLVPLLPMLGLTVRRLHDIGKKGTWIFISLIPFFIGSIWLGVLCVKKGLTRNANRWNWKDTVITIILVLANVGLYVFLGADTEFNWMSDFNRKDYHTEIEVNDSENDIKAEIERQVLEAYRTHEIYNLRTPDFKAAEEAAIAADVPGYATCVDWDYFYATQEDPDFTKVSNVRTEIVDKSKAHVYVTLEYEWETEPETLILVMMRDGQKGKWLVDDVRTTGKYSNSIKDLMINCAKESEGSDDYVDDGSDYYEEEVEDESTLDLGGVSSEEKGFVVIDGSELRLRLGPSTSSETLKWGDGSNRHPEVGEKFRFLDESGDFYKIDYKGNEVWVSKQYSHIEIQ